MKHPLLFKFILLAALLLCRHLSFAQSGWFWQNPLPHGNPLSSVFFTDANTGTAVGSGGTILRTTSGGVTGVEEYVSPAIPAGFSLMQNYPNPFNPSTTIRFSLASAAFASLKVFAITGQEIATLVNKEMSPGIYEVTWNASALPSSVYSIAYRRGHFPKARNSFC